MIMRIFVFWFLSLFIFCGAFPQDDNASEIPDWLKRVELASQWETDEKPIFYFQTVQPLYQDVSMYNTVFIQPRISMQSGSTTYNLGVGYRKIISDNLLLGVNLFGDYEDLHEHGRVGLGLEALGQIVEARLNGYFGLTTKRVVESTGTSSTYERVADGLDFELGSPIPYLPWLKVYCSSFWYDFDKFDDKYGWKTRLVADVNDAVTLEFYTWDDNKGEREYGGKLRFSLAFDRLLDIKEAFEFSDEAFSEKDLTEQMLIPVERSFDVTVEKWTEAAGFVVEVGRQ